MLRIFPIYCIAVDPRRFQGFGYKLENSETRKFTGEFFTRNLRLSIRRRSADLLGSPLPRKKKKPSILYLSLLIWWWRTHARHFALVHNSSVYLFIFSTCWSVMGASGTQILNPQILILRSYYSFQYSTVCFHPKELYTFNRSFQHRRFPYKELALIQSRITNRN